MRRTGKKILELWTAILFLVQNPSLLFNLNPQVRASLGLDLKAIFGIIALSAAVVIFASIYFTLTNPVGQAGLAGIFLQIANAIADPFIAAGQGFASLITYYFNPKNWHLVIMPVSGGA